jgi:hypothetical protein
MSGIGDESELYVEAESHMRDGLEEMQLEAESWRAMAERTGNVYPGQVARKLEEVSIRVAVRGME